MDFILDTDHLAILQLQSQPDYARFRAKLRMHPGAVLRTTIISFQEHTQGWLAYINKARTPENALRGYTKLSDLLSNYCQSTVLPFDQAAQDRFTQLQKLRLHVGTMDLRIASIALASGTTLLTRNLRDFRKVPGLVLADWTA